MTWCGRTRLSVLVMCSALVSGCVGLGDGGRADPAPIARAANLERRDIATRTHRLVTFERIGRPGTPLRVYVEGDGFTHVSAREPSRDPTPRNPVGLRLAAADPSANVLYVARPCQYRAPGDDPGCRTAVWTDARYGEPVIAAVAAAVDEAVRRSRAPSVEIAGFSGGGTVAALVAARRTDVTVLRTVAANLDHAAWTRHHGVTPLHASLDAADVAGALAGVPQIHFVGAEDRIVPRAVVESYVARSGSGRRCVIVETVLGARHDEPWPALWPVLLRWPAPC